MLKLRNFETPLVQKVWNHCRIIEGTSLQVFGFVKVYRHKVKANEETEILLVENLSDLYAS